MLPPTAALLQRFGDRLRLARLRRRLAAKLVAERAGMSPMTLRSIERGGSGVTMGAYMAVMQVLGIEKDVNLLGLADPFGRELQDSLLPWRKVPTQLLLAPKHTTKAKLPTAARDRAKLGPFVSPTEQATRPDSPSSAGQDFAGKLLHAQG